MPQKKEEDSLRFKIFETDQFNEDINQIKGKKQEKFYLKVKNYVYPQIMENPYYGLNIKKLKNYKPETWRYRIGDYRLFYEINDDEKIISMIAFDIRQDAY